MKTHLKEHFGINAISISPLDGYISENYRVDTDSESYVLKIYPDDKIIEAEINGETELIKALHHLPPTSISRTISNLNNELLTKTNGQIWRLQTFVEGGFLAEKEHSEQLIHSFGEFLGEIDTHLVRFRNPAIESRRLIWNLENFNDVLPLANQIKDPQKRKIIEHFIIQWNEKVWPKWPLLRKSIIHNDANDWNVLVQEKGFGIIDLGDSSYTALIAELAIAASYVMMNKADPVKWLGYLSKGYHRKLALEPIELDLLYYLIAARLVTSVCKSAEQSNEQPDNEYIQISEKGAWTLLEQWIQINPIRVRKTLYQSCELNLPKENTPNELIQRRHRVISKGVSISYDNPIHMDSAIFQYMFDKQGNRILDAYNNIPHVGHQHPKIVAAAQKQIALLNTNTRYLYDSLADYAEQLLSKFPPSLDKVYFVNSGSAASDLALRLAQTYTNKHKTIVLEHGYHGNTRMGIEVSQYKYGNAGGRGASAHIIEAALPDVYRGTFKSDDAGILYAEQLIKKIKDQNDIAAFIAEPIVGCGGQVPLADDYLKKLYPRLKDQGILRISDEVQTGFGRVGSHFWGFEMHGVTPDIVILGKPIANGHPMGAVVTTSAVAEAFDNGMEFFSSFGGNPVSCQIGKAVLEVIEEESLLQNALAIGTYKKELLLQLKKDFHEIGDIRGSGLFLGIEFIKDENLTPNTELAHIIKNELRNRNILVSTDGPFNSVIKSKPPMCFSKSNADELIDQMHDILKKSIK